VETNKKHWKQQVQQQQRRRGPPSGRRRRGGRRRSELGHRVGAVAAHGKALIALHAELSAGQGGGGVVAQGAAGASLGIVRCRAGAVAVAMGIIVRALQQHFQQPIRAVLVLDRQQAVPAQARAGAAVAEEEAVEGILVTVNHTIVRWAGSPPLASYSSRALSTLTVTLQVERVGIALVLQNTIQPPVP
jgi:hypothetical protein